MGGATLREFADRDEAEHDLRKRWPVGPAAHPRFLGIIRKYYLACHELNKEIGASNASHPQDVQPHFPSGGVQDETISEDQRDLPISPAVFVGEMLFSEDSRDLEVIVGALPYWPIGTDKKGATV